MNRRHLFFVSFILAALAALPASARIKLTALYIAIITAVVVLLSSSFYAVHDRRVRDLQAHVSVGIGQGHTKPVEHT